MGETFNGGMMVIIPTGEPTTITSVSIGGRSQLGHSHGKSGWSIEEPAAVYSNRFADQPSLPVVSFPG